jgi:hypothetical protein
MKIHIGVIESDFNDKNSNSSSWSTTDEIKGWGKRYKVRILGVHSEDKSTTPSSSLPIAEVIYPVTAGTGHEACYQTDALKPGSTVILWEDDNKRLFITGCKGNNEQTNLFRGDTPTGFIPYSLTYSGPSFNFSTVDNKFFESSSNIQYLNNWANYYELSDGKRTSALTASSVCDKAPVGQIQIAIQNFIKDVNEAKIWLLKQKQSIQSPITETNYSGISTGSILNKTIDNQQLFLNTQKASTQTYSIDQWLNNKIQNVSKDISKYLKDIVYRIQIGSTNLINDALKDVYYTLFPNELQKFKDKVETANDLIACLFRKIIRNLLKMVANFLKSAADYVINPAICIIENFIGGLLGKIIGLISDAINAILQPLNTILGAFDVASNILNLVEDILTTLSCDETPSCPQIQEWSIWGGPEAIFTTSNLSDIFNKIKSFSTSLTQSIDLDNFDFDLDFSDVFESNCNIGALTCGPPEARFIGGGGSGASGNAIINSLGQLIGIDITSFGKNYTSSPIIKIYDSCGNGSGAVARAIIGPVNISSSQTTTTTATQLPQTTTTTNSQTTTPFQSTTPSSPTTSNTTNGVINVVIEDPGSGYIPTPDGSTGATGSTLTDSVSTNKTTINYPILSNGSYPVIMKLCEIVIEDGGFGYTQSDTIEIAPSNGAIAKPYFTNDGSLYKIEIISKGEGFKSLPSITINTKTGYNAILLPRLCSEQIGDKIISPTLDKIITVIDCPGNRK